MRRRRPARRAGRRAGEGSGRWIRSPAPEPPSPRAAAARRGPRPAQPPADRRRRTIRAHLALARGDRGRGPSARTPTGSSPSRSPRSCGWAPSGPRRGRPLRPRPGGAHDHRHGDRTRRRGGRQRARCRASSCRCRRCGRALRRARSISVWECVLERTLSRRRVLVIGEHRSRRGRPSRRGAGAGWRSRCWSAEPAVSSGRVAALDAALRHWAKW